MWRCGGLVVEVWWSSVEVWWSSVEVWWSSTVLWRCGGLVVRVLDSRSPVPGSFLGPGPPHSVV